MRTAAAIAVAGILAFANLRVEAQLYVQDAWVQTTSLEASAQAHSEFRSGIYWSIDYGVFLYLTNAIDGPVSRSLDVSGYGQVDRFVGIADQLSAPLPWGCYRANANASGGGGSQGASTSAFCLDEPPPPPPGGTDNDGGGTDPGDGCWPCPESPILLDLAGDGILTTGAESPVRFDLNADGTRELIGWSDPDSDDAFLWIDLDYDHHVTDGRELFGIGTTLPDGSRATNGFEALRAFDEPRNGGNADGRISSADRLWPRLSLWLDGNHDGISDPREVSPIHRLGVVELLLEYRLDPTPDEHGNLHLLKGWYVRRQTDQLQTGIELRRMEMTDVFFRVLEE